MARWESGRRTGAELGRPHPAGQEPIEGLPPARRRSAHLEAAEITSDDAAWFHRVAAASHADEPLACALESAALGAAPAGPGRPGPAQLMEWAADLSMSSGARVRRVLAAAMQCVYAGHPGSSRAVGARGGLPAVTAPQLRARGTRGARRALDRG